MNLTDFQLGMIVGAAAAFLPASLAAWKYLREERLLVVQRVRNRQITVEPTSRRARRILKRAEKTAAA